MTQPQQITLPSTTEISLKVKLGDLNTVMDSLQQRSNATQALIGDFQNQVNDQLKSVIETLQV